MDAILVVNAGSSSLKFQIFEIADTVPKRCIRGQIDGIGVRPRLMASAADGTVLVDRRYAPEAVDHLPAAIAETRAWLLTLKDFTLRATGHRVVHGGPDYATPILMDYDTLDKLATFQELAPLHQPNNLAPIRLAMEINPDVPQVGNGSVVNVFLAHGAARPIAGQVLYVDGGSYYRMTMRRTKLPPDLHPAELK